MVVPAEDDMSNERCTCPKCAGERLSMAAPDLLQAAKVGLGYVEAVEHSLLAGEGMGRRPNIVTKDADVIRAAIAKAEPRE